MCGFVEAESASQRFGRLMPDILLNCAGINMRSQVENFTDESTDAVGGLLESGLDHDREAQITEHPSYIPSLWHLAC